MRTGAAGLMYLPKHTPDTTIRVSTEKVPEKERGVLEMYLTLEG
jgi:hypothetical protein